MEYKHIPYVYIKHKEKAKPNSSYLNTLYLHTLSNSYCIPPEYIHIYCKSFYLKPIKILYAYLLYINMLYT